MLAKGDKLELGLELEYELILFKIRGKTTQKQGAEVPDFRKANSDEMNAGSTHKDTFTLPRLPHRAVSQLRFRGCYLTGTAQLTRATDEVRLINVFTKTNPERAGSVSPLD